MTPADCLTGRAPGKPGFGTRPLGDVVFGHFGDRVGRKKMLVTSLLLMGPGLRRRRASGVLRRVFLVTHVTKHLGLANTVALDAVLVGSIRGDLALDSGLDIGAAVSDRMTGR